MRERARGLVILAVGALNLSLLPKPEWRSVPPQFVTSRGQALFRDGEKFRFVGVNCYGLAEYADRAPQIMAALATHGVKAVRFWAFQSFCGPGGLDFSRFDALVAAAKRNDILLLPVLDNHWSHCTSGDRRKPWEWYESGWKTAPFAGAALCYRDYVRAIGAHFRDEPQIFAWQLVNEPEIYPDTEENFAVLRRFAAEAAQELKQVDPHHLISLGLLGLGQPATTDKRFRALHSFAVIDLVTAHDHNQIRNPLPGYWTKTRANTFYGDLCHARSLQKPFLATESAIPLSWVNGDRAQRADLFRAKLQAFFKVGGCGYFLWNYEPVPDTDCGFNDDDPIMQVLTETAADLSF